MKIVLAIALSFVASYAVAQTQYVNATVTNVYPVYQDVPVVECQTVHVYKHKANVGDVATGAIIGGLIGNQFGHGNGKTAMTALGMVIGANMAGQPQLKVVDQQQCVSYNKQEFVGYEISYYWNGLQSEMISSTPYNIGDNIVVSVTMN